MPNYVNKTCPKCGGYVRMLTNGDFCESCGYKLVETENSKVIPYSHDEIRQIFAEQDKKIKTDQIQIDNAPGLFGWICPKCGAVISPYTSFCPNCTQHNFEITCTTQSNPVNTSQQVGINEPIKAFNVNDFIGGRKDKLGYE